MNGNDNGQKRPTGGMDFAGAARFLDRAIAAGCNLLELRSSGPEGVESVCSWDLPGVTVDEADECARNDSVGRTGQVRYLLAARKEGSPDLWGRWAFVLDAGSGNFGEENATLAGIVVECIRDKRDVTKMALGYTESLFARFQQMLEFHGAVAAKAEEKHMAMLELMENLVSHQDDRKLKHAEMELHALTTKRMIDTFTPLIPAAANRLLGHLTGTPAPLAAEAMSEFLKSFTPEQLAYFAEKMNPGQLVAFSEMMRTVANQETKKEQEEAGYREERARGAGPSATSGTNATVNGGGVG